MRIPLLVCLSLAAGLYPAAAETDLESRIGLARQAGDNLAVIELLRRWLDAHPGDPAAVEELVGLWLEVDDFSMAEASLKLGAPPDEGLVARTKAEIAWRRDDDIDGAVVILQTRCAAAPKDRDSRLLLADYLARSGNRRVEIGVLDTLIGDGADADLLLDRAEAKLAVEDADGSLRDFRLAASMDPDGESIRNVRPAYERLEKALSETRRLDQEPDGPSVRFQKSYWWLFGGVPARALVDAEAGLKGWPDSAAGKILRARALVGTGQITPQAARADLHVDTSAALEEPACRDAILQADAMLAAKPGDPKFLVQRASWLNQASQYDLALSDIEAALARDPKNIPALHYAVAISRRLGNFPAATAYAQKLAALKAGPSILADVYAGLAEMAFEQSNFPLALEFAGRSLAAMPTTAVWKLKAACHSRLGQPNEAAEALAKAEKGAR